MNEKTIDFDGLDKEIGSEYDLREAERHMFAKMYAAFLDSYFKCQQRNDPELDLTYLNASKTIISSIKRYAAHNEELYDDAEDMEDSITESIKRIKEGIVTMGSSKRDNVKELVEDLRHEANLRIPQKKKSNPEQAWKKGK